MIDTSGIKTVFIKEWKCFSGSDRAVFFLYIILVVSWSFLIANNTTLENAGSFWLVFFSVIVAANFSNTVFISERVTGALEIFMTSGISRDSILFGKMVFVFLMSSFMGIFCIILGVTWQATILEFSTQFIGIYEIIVYLSSAILNIGSSAFLSVKMTNPRLLHFANILISGVLITLYAALGQFLYLPQYILPLVLISGGITMSFFARREFNSEKILQPVIL